MKRFRIIAFILALLMIITVNVSCTGKDDVENNVVENTKQEENNENGVDNGAFPVEVEDKFGNKVVIEKEPMRIISISPSNTEILFALGLGDRIVGVSAFSDYPEEAKTKEVVGDAYGINLERVIELQPDLVIFYGAGNENEKKVLKEAGINVLGFASENFDEIIEEIEVIGKATGRSEEAKKVIDSIKEKRDYVLEKIKDAKKVRVFYEIWHDPLMAAGKGSFMDELITLAGGENIAHDSDTPYPQYDLELLIERDPEVYLASKDIDDKTIESIMARPGYENISAIKNNRIYLFEGNEANLVSRPGPRIGEALEVVAKAIHPELFK